MQIDEVRYAEDLEPLGLDWIKLGLNDVLYDPKTKTIYTPNTNQTSVMGESTLQGEPEDAIIEPRGDYIQGSDGKMQGSRPGGRKASKRSSKERGYNPDDYENLTVGFEGNTERNETGDFESRAKRKEHAVIHMESVGAKSEREYAQMAVEFMSKPLGANMEELKLRSGKRYRYDYSTNEFGVANENNNVSTYYSLDKGAKAWKDKVLKEGVLKGGKN